MDHPFYELHTYLDKYGIFIVITSISLNLAVDEST
jgi:hypothetical protein